jgi:hypothetical protein
MTVVKLSQVQRTMLEQLKAMDPLFMGSLGVRTILVDGENKLRFHTKHEGGIFVNVDWEYLPGPDLYKLSFHRGHALHPDELRTITVEDVLWEDVYDTIREKIHEVLYG